MKDSPITCHKHGAGQVCVRACLHVIKRTAPVVPDSPEGTAVCAACARDIDRHDLEPICQKCLQEARDVWTGTIMQ